MSDWAHTHMAEVRHGTDIYLCRIYEQGTGGRRIARIPVAGRYYYISDQYVTEGDGWDHLPYINPEE